MALSFTINGTDWLPYVADLSPHVAETKYTARNIKGGVITPVPRASVAGYSLQMHVPYATKSQADVLRALCAAAAPVNVTQSGFEFPSGSYVPTAFASSRVPMLESFVYNVMVTLTLDIAPKLPVPVNTGSLSSGGIATHIGM